MTNRNFQLGILTDDSEVVMWLNNKKCKVSVEIEYDEHSSMPLDAKLDIVFTDEPLTKSKAAGYYRFGPFPDFTQSACWPVSAEFKPYTFICTVDNSWGDMGNGNVFALLEETETGYAVLDVFVEASCC